MNQKFSLLVIFLFVMLIATAQEKSEFIRELESLQNNSTKLDQRIDQLSKQLDDLMWYQKVGDIAHIDKLYIYGPPKWKEKNPHAMGAGNPVKFWIYTFIPRDIDVNKKYPLIVLPHGGVHADFTTYYTHIIRELVSQGYCVVAADYRGSTGYGKSFYETIDYGGLEIEDVFASRNYMIENYDFIDSKRVGIMGWSHGGLISLMNIFDHPNDYQCAFAGVPVSDLIARMGYYDQAYRDLYEADYHIGQTANENVAEYRRRSPVWNVQKMGSTPLLIHTNTNDDDVNVLEVEELIRALKAEDKKFEYEIFQNVPGGHSFDRMDSKTAQEIRVKIYGFVARYLKPVKPIKNLSDLRKAGYGF
ncbi:MAG: alpha/beta fold hydrolase [Prolixibacteraceae bacterium]